MASDAMAAPATRTATGPLPHCGSIRSLAVHERFVWQVGDTHESPDLAGKSLARAAPHRDRIQAATFGTFDGATSSYGVTFAMFDQHQHPAAFVAPSPGWRSRPLPGWAAARQHLARVPT